MGRARELLSATRTLTSADVAVIQSAVRRALAGEYAVQQVAGEGQRGGRGARDFSSGEHEYLLDARGRILFHRYQTADAAFPGLMRTTILEFTDLPAIRCTDRKAYPERRRGITYYEDHTGWHIGNPMVVDDEGSPWAPDHRLTICCTPDPRICATPGSVSSRDDQVEASPSREKRRN